ncbi:MAG: hypothetical protein ACK4ZJ_01970 [Allorhizobium sp.]
MMGISKIGVTLAAIALTLSAGNASAVPRTSNEHVIRHDRGGYVIDYAIDMLKMEKSRRLVKFAGRCDSACTIYLGLTSAQTCITPAAKFGFHLPFGSDYNGNKVAAKFMMQKYPQWVRQWLKANGGLSSKLKTMPYSYASQHIRPCAGGANTAQQVRY